MDCENAWESINGQAFLNIDLFLAACAFKTSSNHSFTFYEFIETVTEINTTKKTYSSSWYLYTQIHEVVKCTVLVFATKTLCPIYELASKQVSHYRIITRFVVFIPFLTLFIYA